MVSKLHLVWIMALALALRLALVIFVWDEQQRFFNTDSYQFDLLAQNLIEHQQFSLSDRVPYTPDALRTPGYPGLLLACYASLGHRPALALLLNALFGCLCVGGVFWLIKPLGRSVATLAALFLCLDPTSILYSALLVAEPLFGLLLLLAANFWRHAVTSHARWAWLLAGLSLGLATLCKPAATYLILPLAVVTLCLSRQRLKQLRGIALGLVAFALSIAPWVARNAQVFGIYQTSAIQEENLLRWNVAVLVGRQQGVSLREAQSRLEDEALAGRQRDELAVKEWTRLFRRTALKYIAATPFDYALVHARGSLATLLDPGRLDLSRVLGGVEWHVSLLDTLTRHGLVATLATLARLPAVLLVPLLLNALWLLAGLTLALRGIWLARSQTSEAARVVLWTSLIFAAYFVVIPGPIGGARFRVPVTPFVVGFAALALYRAKSRTSAQDTKAPNSSDS